MFPCNHDISEDRERVGERSGWGGCVSSVGSDNGDEQVRKVVLFPLCTSEMLQKQPGWIRQCVCMRVCVRHHMDINLRGMRNQLPSANANQL